jgi:hypothetical protein
MKSRLAAGLIVAQVLCASALLGAEITSGTLQIQGMTLELETVAVTTGIDVATTIQTKFAGKTNDAAPSIDGLAPVSMFRSS